MTAIVVFTVIAAVTILLFLRVSHEQLNARISAKAIFQFDGDGKLINVRADRYRDLGSGKFVLTPWTGQCSEYREFSGFRVPTLVDVGWEVEQERFSYARFKLTGIDYNVREPSR